MRRREQAFEMRLDEMATREANMLASTKILLAREKAAEAKEYQKKYNSIKRFKFDNIKSSFKKLLLLNISNRNFSIVIFVISKPSFSLNSINLIKKEGLL